MFKSDTQKHQERLDEELLFSQAAHEIASGAISTGLYAKAVAECNGNEQLARARYIHLRVEMMKSERAAFHEQARLAALQVENQSHPCTIAPLQDSKSKLNPLVRVFAVLLGILLALAPVGALIDGNTDQSLKLLFGMPLGVWLAYCGLKGESFNPFIGKAE